MYVCDECGASGQAPAVCPDHARPLVFSDDPLLGTDVGRYRVVRVLGKGGMGSVYLGVQQAVGARVAIKVIAEQYARDQQLLDRFFTEARAVNLIRHGGIVTVHDFVRLPDGRPAIVMEVIEGKTLREIVQSGLATPLGGVVHLAIEVLGALEAAHAIGIVHRDLKPDNILVSPSGRAKVLDFGIAKLAGDVPGQPTPRTRTGVVLGTPEYMSPEQINGGLADARSDVYSMGVVLFEAFTGRRPFDAATDFEVMRAHVDLEPPSACAWRRDLPPELERVLERALAKHPEQRYAGALELAHALYEASATIPAETWRSLAGEARLFRQPPPPIPPRPVHGTVATVAARPAAITRQRPRSRAVLIGGLVLAACVGGGVVALVMSRETTPDAIAGTPKLLAAPSGITVYEQNGTRVASEQAFYDMRMFDLTGTYLRAERLARSITPDAGIVMMSAPLVGRTGRVDLTADLGHNSKLFYMFQSTKAKPGDPYCVASVDPTDRVLAAYSTERAPCTHTPIRAPRCNLIQVWVKAKLALGFDDDTRLNMTYLLQPNRDRPGWWVVSDYSSDVLYAEWFADDC